MNKEPIIGVSIWPKSRTVFVPLQIYQLLIFRKIYVFTTSFSFQLRPILRWDKCCAALLKR